MPRALSKESQDRVRYLLDTGLGDDEISKRSGVGRATVRRWRRRGFPTPTTPVTFQPEWWGADRRRTYAYLLGQYLGDGYVGLIGDSSSLVLACDAQYERIIEECLEAIAEFAPNPPALLLPPDTKGTRIVSYWAGWRLMFPQHGPGKKHEREIRLEEWQEAIVEEFPKDLIRGLIHSDGSRCLNTFTVELKGGPREYSYPRYFFTNYSADIRRIFCEGCDRIGVRWSRSNWRNISISHRRSVALLDGFVGPKG